MAHNDNLPDAITTGSSRPTPRLAEGERFNVVLFFPDGGPGHFEKSNVTVDEAMETAMDFARRPAARIGMIERIIITDSGNSVCLEWQFGKGVTFPHSPTITAWNARYAKPEEV